jgi:AraC-like DNA-binding protein
MLKPATANLVLGIPANYINNAVIKCDDIWSLDGALIAEQIAGAKDSGARFHIVENFLLRRIRNSIQSIDKRISEYERLVSFYGGNINIKTAAAHLNISCRQLERKVLETIGATPKEFSKVIRFQKALAIKQFSNDLDCTSLAYKCGYYDQSHFIKEFKSITGLTPQNYFQWTKAYSDYYSF